MSLDDVMDDVTIWQFSTLGEMTRLESHQAENEIFEFSKNFFFMA